MASPSQPLTVRRWRHFHCSLAVSGPLSRHSDGGFYTLTIPCNFMDGILYILLYFAPRLPPDALLPIGRLLCVFPVRKFRSSLFDLERPRTFNCFSHIRDISMCFCMIFRLRCSRKPVPSVLQFPVATATLRAFFAKYGEIIEAIVMKDSATKRSRGFGFIVFASSSSVDRVLAERDLRVDGRKV